MIPVWKDLWTTHESSLPQGRKATDVPDHLHWGLHGSGWGILFPKASAFISCVSSCGIIWQKICAKLRSSVRFLGKSWTFWHTDTLMPTPATFAYSAHCRSNSVLLPLLEIHISWRIWSKFGGSGVRILNSSLKQSWFSLFICLTCLDLTYKAVISDFCGKQPFSF